MRASSWVPSGTPSTPCASAMPSPLVDFVLVGGVVDRLAHPDVVGGRDLDVDVVHLGHAGHQLGHNAEVGVLFKTRHVRIGHQGDEMALARLQAGQAGVGIGRI